MKNKSGKLKRILNILFGKKKVQAEAETYNYEPSSCETYQPLVHNYRMTEPGSRFLAGDAYSAGSIETPDVQFC